MIAEHILGNVRDGVTETVVNIPFEWFETEKKRIAKTAEDGTEFGVCVGEPLHDGDILARENGKVYAVRIAPSRLIETRVFTMQEMGRLCFEMGNRHLSLKIEPDRVTVPYDEPTLLYLQHLGFDAHETHAAKCVPLRQLEAQRVLRESFPQLLDAVRTALSVIEDEIGIGGPAFDIFAMQHETLYSRLYMS